MNLTKQFLIKHKACPEGIVWFEKQRERDLIKILRLLVKDNHWDWANWLIVCKMRYKEYVSYAVFAAEQVLPIYEKKYPDNKRPRKAIEAAKKCIKNPSRKNKVAASVAAAAAYAAAYVAANAAAAAANAAANVAAAAADDDAIAAAATTNTKMKLKILNYGIKLLKGRKI